MRYFIIAASKDHVVKGVAGGFAQSGHGKHNQLDRLSKNDKIIYYSAKDVLEKGKAYQKFTAIGTVIDEASYQATVSPSFKPYRRNIQYNECKEAEIKPLLNDLIFIKDVKHWGFYLMSGFVEISKEDYTVIANVMLK